MAVLAGGGIFGAGVTYASLLTSGQDLQKQQTALAAQVNEHFALSDRTREQQLQVVNTRLDGIAAVTSARMDTNERRDELRADRLSTVDNRLNRLEAQLAYMVQLAGASKK